METVKSPPRASEQNGPVLDGAPKVQYPAPSNISSQRTPEVATKPGKPGQVDKPRAVRETGVHLSKVCYSLLNRVL